MFIYILVLHELASVSLNMYVYVRESHRKYHEHSFKFPLSSSTIHYISTLPSTKECISSTTKTLPFFMIKTKPSFSIFMTKSKRCGFILMCILLIYHIFPRKNCKNYLFIHHNKMKYSLRVVWLFGEFSIKENWTT